MSITFETFDLPKSITKTSSEKQDSSEEEKIRNHVKKINQKLKEEMKKISRKEHIAWKNASHIKRK